MFAPIQYYTVVKSIVEEGKNGWELLLGGMCNAAEKKRDRTSDIRIALSTFVDCILNWNYEVLKVIGFQWFITMTMLRLFNLESFYYLTKQ